MDECDDRTQRGWRGYPTGNGSMNVRSHICPRLPAVAGGRGRIELGGDRQSRPARRGRKVLDVINLTETSRIGIARERADISFGFRVRVGSGSVQGEAPADIAQICLQAVDVRVLG